MTPVGVEMIEDGHTACYKDIQSDKPKSDCLYVKATHKSTSGGATMATIVWASHNCGGSATQAALRA